MKNTEILIFCIIIAKMINDLLTMATECCFFLCKYSKKLEPYIKFVT